VDTERAVAAIRVAAASWLRRCLIIVVCFLGVGVALR
jgi:hypothetical protein